MTREDFIEILEGKGYSYEIVGEELIVTHKGHVYLDGLETLPPGVEFKNEGEVDLSSLKTLPPGVEFKNGGDINLRLLKTISSGVKFKNTGWVSLPSLETIPVGVEFSNEERVWLGSLMERWFEDWKGNIEGVNSKRLLNVMISKGIFER